MSLVKTGDTTSVIRFFFVNLTRNNVSGVPQYSAAGSRSQNGGSLLSGSPGTRFSLQPFRVLFGSKSESRLGDIRDTSASLPPGPMVPIWSSFKSRRGLTKPCARARDPYLETVLIEHRNQDSRFLFFFFFKRSFFGFWSTVWGETRDFPWK